MSEASEIVFALTMARLAAGTMKRRLARLVGNMLLVRRRETQCAEEFRDVRPRVRKIACH